MVVSSAAVPRVGSLSTVFAMSDQLGLGEFGKTQDGLANSEDAAEGVQSFIKRRDPVFKGR